MAGVQHREVGRNEAGMRLDRWFRAHFPTLTQGRLQKLLRTGQVRVDGARAKADLRLEAGQAIRIPPLGEPVEAPADGEAPRPLSNADRALIRDITLYEDDWLMVLNKPFGLASQGGSKTTRHVDGLLMGLADASGQRPVLAHRLDRDTSGVLIVAKDRGTAARLGKLLMGRAVRKIYWALVRGVPHPAQALIDVPLVKASGPDGDRVRPAEPGEEGAQKAQTHYAVVDRAAAQLAFVSLKPVTGRQHQLRAHMAAIGHPIAGDNKYRGDVELPAGIPTKLHLHARRVSFPHPSVPGGKRMVDVTAPLPPHMRASWELLGFDLAYGGGADDDD